MNDSMEVGTERNTTKEEQENNPSLEAPPLSVAPCNNPTFKEEEERPSDEEAMIQEPSAILHWICSPATWLRTCFPPPSAKKQSWLPLIVGLTAFVVTAYGSWDCTYILSGATISFTGATFGLWTLQDSLGKCQLWDVLFFSYKLDTFLQFARFSSMFGMLLGLALVAVLSQALQFHAASWMLGVLLALLIFFSVVTSSIFNIWTFFFWFTYVILILIARYWFVFPVPRRISPNGCRFIALCFGFNGLCCWMTLLILLSDFCRCDNIVSYRLEGRTQYKGDFCNGECFLGPAGITMIFAGALWFIGMFAVLKCGVQPEELRVRGSLLATYAHYPRSSVRTRMYQSVRTVAQSGYTVAQTGYTVAKQGYDMASKAVADIQNNSGSQSGSVIDESSVHDAEQNDANMNEKKTVGFAEAEEERIDDGDEDDDVQVDDLVSKSVAELQSADGAEPVQQKDHRSRCQKFCLDYRVTPRTRAESFCFWLFRTVLIGLIGIYVFFIFLQIGSFQEDKNAAKAPGTSKFFLTEVVCGFNATDPSEPFKSFESKELAVAAGYTVAHCGECGYCSNPYDIRKYVETRKTVAIQAKKCGPTSIFGSYESLVNCLEDRIGFSRPCTECWSQNMVNTRDHCLFTCMTTLLTGFATENNVKTSSEDNTILNQCIFCDERQSGPEFVTCSGVARRRLGIVSEIDRRPEEQCKNMDIDWVSVDFDVLFSDGSSLSPN